MKVYDCTTFFNELELLEVRLNELDPVVDVFVIVEANKTHQGNHKPMVLAENLSRFERFLPKIRHIQIEFPDPLPDLGRDQNLYADNWSRERHQRNCIMQGLKDAQLDDVVMVCDLDEIPSRGAVAAYMATSREEIAFFEMSSFYYFLNTKVGTWIHGKIMPFRLLRLSTPSRIRNHENGISIPAFGGWHYSYMGGAERIVTKYRSFAHQEYNLNDHQTVEGIQYLIDNRMAGNHEQFGHFEFFERYPQFVEENKKQFEDNGFIFIRK